MLRIKLNTEPEMSDIAATLSIMETFVTKDEEDPTTYILNVARSKVAEHLQKLLLKYQVVDIGIQEPSLERVIQRIYSQ